MLQTRNEFKLLAPMALIVAVAICALVGSMWIFARQADTASRVKEETFLRMGMNMFIEHTHVILRDNAVWDDAVVHTDNRYDDEWVSYTYGDYLRNTQGFDLTVLLDGDDTPVFAWRDSERADPSVYNAFREGVNSLLIETRQDWVAQSGEALAHGDHEFAFGKGEELGRLLLIDGHIYAISMHAVVPDKFTKLRQARPHVLIGGIEITPHLLKQIAAQYLVSNVRIVPEGSVLPSSSPRMELHDGTGKTIATLTWTPEAPGHTLFIRALGPVLMISFGLGLIALVLLHHSHKSAQSLIASEARAKHMALHDALTGLPNRTLFSDRFQQVCERLRRQGGKCAVMCIGLDRFKDVNDTLGHVAGDELIRYNANLIATMIRAGDTLARMGGDEFVIIQSDTDGMRSAALAKRVIEALTGNVTLESGQVFSSCSIGVTMVEDADLDPAEALRQADLALYRAKDQGRAQYAFFESEMDATIKLRKMLETGLREAIHVEAINVVYQPQVDHFGNIVGVEALCRWTHPTRGPVSPSYFIPLAEECGLMGLLGQLVMRRAMMDAQRWPGLKVAVNVSATQIKAPDFIANLRNLLGETGAEASQIEIEITEGVLLNDDHQTQIVLRDLRQMGFSIALDDFGTGYSSLSYLSRYPVDKIKIDRSFVSNLGVDPDAEAVIKAIVKLSKALNLQIVAEGVETRAQKTSLRSAGCGIIQGYIFSRPVDAASIDAMLSTKRPLGLSDGDLDGLRQAG